MPRRTIRSAIEASVLSAMISVPLVDAAAFVPIDKNRAEAQDVARGLPSYPVGSAEPVRRTAKVAFISDGFSLQPDNCLLVESSGDPVADDQACKTVQYHKTYPGKPAVESAPVWSHPVVEGDFISPVLLNGNSVVANYRNPSLDPKAQGTIIYRLLIDATGKLTSCEIMGSSGDKLLDRGACVAMSSRAKFRPATLNGQPVAAFVFGYSSHYFGR